jgi:threonine/homoserine/homoserine lactone efflux protein
VLAIAGLSTGIVLCAAVAAGGLAALFASDPRIRSGLQAAGALFLLFVGARMILRGLRGGSHAPHQAPESSRMAYLARGVITNVLNPWILGFYLTMLPLFATGSRSPFEAAALVASVHVTQLALWHGLWVVAVSSVTSVYGRTRALRLAAGVALVATGGWFMFR